MELQRCLWSSLQYIRVFIPYVSFSNWRISNQRFQVTHYKIPISQVQFLCSHSTTTVSLMTVVDVFRFDPLPVDICLNGIFFMHFVISSANITSKELSKLWKSFLKFYLQHFETIKNWEWWERSQLSQGELLVLERLAWRDSLTKVTKWVLTNHYRGTPWY